MWFSRCSFIFLVFKIDVFSLQQDTDYLYSNKNAITNNGYYRHIYYYNPQKIHPAAREKVTIQVYYECLCPDCIKFITTNLVPVIKKLGSHLDIYTYPYGNTKMTHRNGEYKFKCQHGPEECYGNKLHACAIDILHNNTQAVLFNGCMMVQRNGDLGSTDEAADICGIEQNVEAVPIKKCAKSTRGDELLKYYGEESKKANYAFVPYFLINGKVSDRNNFIYDVCASFTNPPEECQEITSYY